jgi:hypothetical protein
MKKHEPKKRLIIRLDEKQPSSGHPSMLRARCIHRDYLSKRFKSKMLASPKQDSNSL